MRCQSPIRDRRRKFTSPPFAQCGARGHLEIADLALAERAGRRHRPAIGHVWPILISVAVTPRISAAAAGSAINTSAAIRRANASFRSHVGAWPMAATGAVQPTLSLVAQTCHGTPQHAIANQDAT
jgi:hypothetical protein